MPGDAEAKCRDAAAMPAVNQTDLQRVAMDRSYLFHLFGAIVFAWNGVGKLVPVSTMSRSRALLHILTEGLRHAHEFLCQVSSCILLSPRCMVHLPRWVLVFARSDPVSAVFASLCCKKRLPTWRVISRAGLCEKPCTCCAKGPAAWASIKALREPSPTCNEDGPDEQNVAVVRGWVASLFSRPRSINVLALCFLLPSASVVGSLAPGGSLAILQCSVYVQPNSLESGQCGLGEAETVAASRRSPSPVFARCASYEKAASPPPTRVAESTHSR